MRALGYLIVIALACSAAAAAEIYRWTDGEGNVIYSDTPQPGAEKVELSETTIVPSTPVPTVPAVSKVEKRGAKPYESVVVIRPSDEETIWDNIGDVGVAVEVRPGLQAGFGHTLQVLFDGQEIAPPGRAMNFTLPGVDRGAHTLQAVILDSNGRAFARSPISTFYIHKQAIRRRAR